MKKIKNVSLYRYWNEGVKGVKQADGGRKKTPVTWKGGIVEMTDTNGNTVRVESISRGKALAQAGAAIVATAAAFVGASIGVKKIKGSNEENESSVENIEA